MKVIMLLRESDGDAPTIALYEDTPEGMRRAIEDAADARRRANSGGCAEELTISVKLVMPGFPVGAV
jgi:hypothetical protein